MTDPTNEIVIKTYGDVGRWNIALMIVNGVPVAFTEGGRDELHAVSQVLRKVFGDEVPELTGKLRWPFR